MIDIMIIAGSGLVVLFGFVVLFGAPYVPTLNKEVEAALDLLDLEAGDTLLELGSGDGKVLRAAAERGINSVGYELNPLLVLWSRGRCLRYRNKVSARVHMRSYWSATWPSHDGVYVFSAERYMRKLDKKIIQSTQKNSNVNIVTFGAQLPGREPHSRVRGLTLYRFKP